MESLPSPKPDFLFPKENNEAPRGQGPGQSLLYIVCDKGSSTAVPEPCSPTHSLLETVQSQQQEQMGGKDLLPGVQCLQGPRTCQNAGCLAFCHDRASGVRAEQSCPPNQAQRMLLLRQWFLLLSNPEPFQSLLSFCICIGNKFRRGLITCLAANENGPLKLRSVKSHRCVN